MSETNSLFSQGDIKLMYDQIKSSTIDSESNIAQQATLFIISLAIGIIFAFPLYWLVKISLTSENLYQGAPSLSLNHIVVYNFIDVWYQIPFLSYFLNSLFITLIAVGGNLLFNTLISYSLIREFRGRRIVSILLVLGMLIPFQTSIIPAFLVTKNLGLLNTRLGVALPYAAAVINILVLANSFREVPDSLIESARMDGASELYVIFGILWPLSKPALMTNLILSFVFAWNAYLWPLIIISSQDLQPLPLALSNFQSTLSGAYALQYAFVILAITPTVVVFLLLQSQFIRSVATSAIKG